MVHARDRRAHGRRQGVGPSFRGADQQEGLGVGDLRIWNIDLGQILARLPFP